MQRRRNNRYNQDNRFVLNSDSYSGYRSGARYHDEDDYNNSRYYSSSSRHNADQDYDDSDHENENEGDYESSHSMYGNQSQNNGVWRGNSENYHQQDRDLNREKGFGNNYSKLSNRGYKNQSEGGGYSNGGYGQGNYDGRERESVRFYCGKGCVRNKNENSSTLRSRNRRNFSNSRRDW